MNPHNIPVFEILYIIYEDGKRLKTHFKQRLLIIDERILSRILIKLLWRLPLPFPQHPGYKKLACHLPDDNKIVADFSGIYWVTSYYTAGSVAADWASN